MSDFEARKVIKVLVTDDSGFMRLLVSDILNAQPDIEVIGTAADGKDAVEKVISLRPDLLLLDMEMNQYDGLYAIKEVMKLFPLPILILSSTGNTNVARIFEGLHCGAIDYINKPQRNSAKIREIEEKLLRKVRLVSKAKPKRIDHHLESQKFSFPHSFDVATRYKVIVIGASTGGPTALEKVIRKLPGNLNVPVVICQHMPQGFIHGFVERLNALTPLQVVVGQKSMSLVPGHVIVAPAKANMILVKSKSNSAKIDFTMDKYREFNYPSINAMMLSTVDVFKDGVIGVLLTGMGKDGVEGLKAIRDAGGYTVGQNKESCVIYGMPKAAEERGAVMESIDIKEIGNFLVSCLS